MVKKFFTLNPELQIAKLALCKDSIQVKLLAEIIRLHSNGGCTFKDIDLVKIDISPQTMRKTIFDLKKSNHIKVKGHYIVPSPEHTFADTILISREVKYFDK